MAPDRRGVVAALLTMGLLPGCARSAPPVRAGMFALLDPRFLTAEGRIVDSGNGGISHSEGQGYGLIVAEAAADRPAFDRIWGWTQRTLQLADGLFSWKYDPRGTPVVPDPNNATDGDILIAWALARGAARWRDPALAGASATIRAAILGRLVRRIGGRDVLLPALTGFETATGATLNPSYYVWPALDAFRRIDGAAKWGPLIADGQALIAAARFGPALLPTDWVEIDAAGGFAPAVGRPPRFGFDAVRVPLYLAWSGRRAALDPFRRYWAARPAGAAIPAWVDVVTGETAPYPLSAGGTAIVSLILGTPAPKLPAGDYYSSALLDLVRVARG